jgi:hypothetical protein
MWRKKEWLRHRRKFHALEMGGAKQEGKNKITKKHDVKGHEKVGKGRVVKEETGENKVEPWSRTQRRTLKTE